MGRILLRKQVAPVVAENLYARLRVTDSAPYHRRDGARLEFFQGKYWLLGGWDPLPNDEWGTDVTTNSVWSSPDLITWTLELAHDSDPPTTGPTARWRRRHTFMTFVFGGYLWVMGSDTLDGSPWLSDVWRSANGVTWERVAASSPWGPAYLPIPALYGGYMHVIGGHLQGSGLASNQHWRTQDGVTWEQLPNLPFNRASVYSAVELHGKLFIMGGNNGAAQNSAAQCGDTWMWDGTTWTQQSASAGWGVLEWIVTASYDNKLWVLTGKQGAGNAGTLWYSKDEGVTWTQLLPVPYGTSHADAIVVTPQHGIVLATGLEHEQNVYRITANDPDPSTTMPLQPWTSWFDGYSFALGSSIVYGKASAGTSTGRDFGAMNAPGVGTTNGRPTILLDGVNDYLRYTAGAQGDDLFDPLARTVFTVVRIPTPPTNNATPHLNANLGGNTSAFFGLALKSAGPSIVAFANDGTLDQAPPLNFIAGDAICVATRHNGTTLEARIGKGPWMQVASNTANIAGTYVIGANYNLSIFSGLEICEHATADVAIDDAALDACVDDMAAKWGIAA